MNDLMKTSKAKLDNVSKVVLQMAKGGLDNANSQG